MSMNIFRILGDLTHTLSKCILIYAIHSNHSTEGVSLITQALYCLVFISRYLDIFQFNTVWNTSLKFFYILSSLYILFLMMRVYARTREREKAWKLGALCLASSLLLSPVAMFSFRYKSAQEGQGFSWSFQEYSWIFSTILEATCVLPQLLLLRQTTVPTVIDSYYLVALGSYRALYILNWIWRSADITDHGVDPIAVICGIVQTAFYLDFAWVYYSRQRVKLRHGGLVDADDMRQGWLLRRIFHSKRVVGNVDEDDEESAPALGNHAINGDGRLGAPGRNGSSKWGSRGISVSADDAIMEGERVRQNGFADQEDGIVDSALGDDNDPDAKMKDPDELAKILDDDSDDGSDDGVLKTPGEGSVGNGAEWRDGSGTK